MRTLIYCTAFSLSLDNWECRYRRWIEALRISGVSFDQILIVDDGSPVLPAWPDVEVFTEAAHGANFSSSAQVVLYHFTENLGRSALYDFPGWYRSFGFGARYAKQHGFDKVVHLESDAYLISDRARAYVNDLRAGWTVLFCPKYDMPEITVQIICGESADRLVQFVEQPYAQLRGKNHERALPYDHIEKSLVGDRYGEESLDIPLDADFACQVQPLREPCYFWWLHPHIDPTSIATTYKVDFVKEGNSEDFVGLGWSGQEKVRRWMIDDESQLTFGPLDADKKHAFVIQLSPNAHLQHQPKQTLIVCWNDFVVGKYDLYTGTSTLGVDLPQKVINSDQTNHVRFFHPHACQPTWLDNGENRQLAFFTRVAAVRSYCDVASRKTEPIPLLITPSMVEAETVIPAAD